MTSHFPVASDRHQSVANAESATARTADEGPYARPTLPPHRAVDAVLIDAIRASVGPFVPAPWRTASAASTPATSGFITTFQTPAEEPVVEARVDDEAEALPWIESFLDASPPQAHVADEAVTEAVSLAASAEVEAVDEAPSVLFDEPSSKAEEWPLEEAGEAIRAIADDLARPAAASAAVPQDPAPTTAPDAAAPSLRMWSEDDMMDIMPVRNSAPEGEGAEQWAARARRETEEGSAESAARALEAVAARVRSGEIPLSTFSAEMGEAAALSAALAALLNLRR